MKQISIQTKKQNVYVDITEKVKKEITIDDGVVTVFCPHTTAGVAINENADPSVEKDILQKLKDLVPEGDGYDHLEGNSDSHIKTVMTGSSEQVIVEDGELQLGTWQGIFFCEYDGPRTRKIWIKEQKT